MYKRINDYTSKCVTCQESNLKVIKPPMGETDIPMFPFAKVAWDFVGPLPKSLSNSYIVHFQCLYSAWMMCFTVPDKSIDTVCSILIEKVIPQHSSLLCLVMDNGKEFTSSKMEEMPEIHNIKHITTSLYSPQSNGVCERNHQTLLKVLSKKIQGNSEMGLVSKSSMCSNQFLGA